MKLHCDEDGARTICCAAKLVASASHHSAVNCRRSSVRAIYFQQWLDSITRNLLLKQQGARRNTQCLTNERAEHSGQAVWECCSPTGRQAGRRSTRPPRPAIAISSWWIDRRRRRRYYHQRTRCPSVYEAVQSGDLISDRTASLTSTTSYSYTLRTIGCTGERNGARSAGPFRARQQLTPDTHSNSSPARRNECCPK